MSELVSKFQELARIAAIKPFTPKIVLTEESAPFSDECQIEASNDLAAVNAWLKKHSDKRKTFDAYRREAERLLLWCVYERGLPLAKLKAHDFGEYFKFLKAPPDNWCTTKAAIRAGRKSDLWRPFLGPLSKPTYAMAVRCVNSLINYLVSVNYLRFNPIKLVEKIDKLSVNKEEHKYAIWERMLEEDEWAAVQEALEEMPEEGKHQVDNKIRTQVLFAVLYFLGLRINEVATSSWNAFRYRNGQWWFFIKGKGDKLGHIPVNDKLLSFVKIYRLHLDKVPLPNPDEYEYLFVSRNTKRPLSARQLYNLVKVVGAMAANKFSDNPLKQQKLLKLSPHWLRHLSASHQDRAGVAATLIQANHRHSSSQTTQIYVHAEDELRHQEIQKLDMAVRLKLFTEKKEEKLSAVRLEIALTAGPVCEASSLDRLIEVIEENILQDIAWQRQARNKSDLVKQYEKLRSLGRPLVIVYQLDDLKEGVLDFIKRAVLREAEIRLFGCDIKINKVCFEKLS